MNEILSGSFEESYNKILEFMQKENEAFMKSLPDAQKQMIQSWEDTWKKASDIIDSNYARIQEIIDSKDEYIEFMKATDRTYRYYIENGDENSARLMEIDWAEKYDNYINSIKDTAEFDPHAHTLSDVASKIDELKDNIFQVNIVGIDGEAPSPYGLSDYTGKYQDFSNGEDVKYADVDSHYKPVEPPAPSGGGDSSGGGSGSGGSSSVQKKQYYITTKDKSGASKGDIIEASSYNEAKKIAEQKAKEMGRTLAYVSEKPLKNEVHGYTITHNGQVQKTGTTTTKEAAEKQASATMSSLKSAAIAAAKTKPAGMPEYDWQINKIHIIASKLSAAQNGWAYNAYKQGGLADYTGLAWVDGTKQRPESFLDAVDTEILRSMLDEFKYIRSMPHMSHIDPSMYGGNTNVGDINITINQAEINSDTDVDKLAKRVGQAFSKELSRNGLNLSGYAF